VILSPLAKKQAGKNPGACAPRLPQKIVWKRHLLPFPKRFLETTRSLSRVGETSCIGTVVLLKGATIRICSARAAGSGAMECVAARV